MEKSSAIHLYQGLYHTREVPYCGFPRHPHGINDVNELTKCVLRDCPYLYSLFPEEIDIIMRYGRGMKPPERFKFGSI
jgi:hypothetical protein